MSASGAGKKVKPLTNQSRVLDMMLCLMLLVGVQMGWTNMVAQTVQKSAKKDTQIDPRSAPTPQRHWRNIGTGALNRSGIIEL